MFPVFSLFVACTSPKGAPLDSGVPADTGAPLDSGVSADSGVPADSAGACGETAPAATLALAFRETVLDGGPGTVRTEITWTDLSVGATDADGDLASWTLELWWVSGDAALDTARPADASELIDAYPEEEVVPPCATPRVEVGWAWVLSEDAEVSLLTPGAPYSVAAAVTDEGGLRSELVTVAGVAPEL